MNTLSSFVFFFTTIFFVLFFRRPMARPGLESLAWCFPVSQRSAAVASFSVGLLFPNSATTAVVTFKNQRVRHREVEESALCRCIILAAFLLFVLNHLFVLNERRSYLVANSGESKSATLLQRATGVTRLPFLPTRVGGAIALTIIAPTHGLLTSKLAGLLI